MIRLFNNCARLTFVIVLYQIFITSASSQQIVAFADIEASEVALVGGSPATDWPTAAPINSTVIDTAGDEWQIDSNAYILINGFGYATCYQLGTDSNSITCDPAGTINGVSTIRFERRQSTSSAHTGEVIVELDSGSGFVEFTRINISNSPVQGTHEVTVNQYGVQRVRLKSTNTGGNAAGRPYIYWVEVNDMPLAEQNFSQQENNPDGAWPSGTFGPIIADDGHAYYGNGVMTYTEAFLGMSHGYWMRNNGDFLEADFTGAADPFDHGIGSVQFGLHRCCTTAGKTYDILVQYSINGGAFTTFDTVHVDYDATWTGGTLNQVVDFASNVPVQGDVDLRLVVANQSGSNGQGPMLEYLTVTEYSGPPPANITVNPKNIDAGTQFISQTPQQQQIVISNSALGSTATLTIVDDSGLAFPFSIANAPVPGSSLDGISSLTFDVDIELSQLGSFSDELYVRYADKNGDQICTITMTANVIDTAVSEFPFAEKHAVIAFEADDTPTPPFFDTALSNYTETDNNGNSWIGTQVQLSDPYPVSNTYQGQPNSCVISRTGNGTLQFIPAEKTGVGSVSWFQRPSISSPNFVFKLQYRVDQGAWIDAHSESVTTTYPAWAYRSANINLAGDVELRWLYQSGSAGNMHIDYICITDYYFPFVNRRLVDMKFVTAECERNSWPSGNFTIKDYPEGNSWTGVSMGTWNAKFLERNSHNLANNGSMLTVNPVGTITNGARISCELARGSSSAGNGIHRIQYNDDGAGWVDALVIPVDNSVNAGEYIPYSVDVPGVSGNVDFRFTYETANGYSGNAIDDIVIEQLTNAPTPYAVDLKVVAFGDSTTQIRNVNGTRLQVYADVLSMDLWQYGIGVRMLNEGIGGNKTNQGIARFTNDVLNHNPDVVVIQFGINDSYDDNPVDGIPRLDIDSYEANLRQMVTTARTNGIKPILMTSNLVDDRANTQFLASFLQRCRDVAADMDVPLVDVYQGFQDYETNENSASGETNSRSKLLIETMPSGVHPDLYGQRRGADLLKPILAECFLSPAIANSPVPDSTDVPIDSILDWKAGSLGRTHDLYFGTTTPPPFVGNFKAVTEYDPGQLLENTTYYWRVNERNLDAMMAGGVWHFTTGDSTTEPPTVESGSSNWTLY